MEADEYDLVKRSSLKFKGEKRKKHRKKDSLKLLASESEQNAADRNPDERQEDAEEHGGWWKASKYQHIRDDVAIEFLPGCYARALNNGSIVLGNPHPPGEGPDEEEIFTAMCVSTNQIALKTGFGRYLSVDSKKRLVGLSEAIGDQETFLPVFEDDKLALCAYNDCFLSPEDTEDVRPIVACSSSVGPLEMLSIRINHDPSSMDSRESAKTSANDILADHYQEELGYIKKNRDLGSHKAQELRQLKKARLEGELNEALLNSRVKKKSDKYCK